MNPPALALVLAAGAPACDPPAPPAPPVSEPAKMELSIGENSVATVGTWRVALAKTWEEQKTGGGVKTAWLSIVEKGSTTGPVDVELGVGQTFALGARTFEVTDIAVAPGGAGSVAVREK